MKTLAELFYFASPRPLQDLAISIFNLNYYKRCGGWYSERKAAHRELYYRPLPQQQEVQRDCLRTFLRYVADKSPYYRRLWAGLPIDEIQTCGDLRVLPTVTKEDIRVNFDAVRTIAKRDAQVGHTGGTTGKSLQVYMTWPDCQDRQATLDFYREQFGWKLGKRTAWFSGKTLLTESDVRKRRFWKTDWRLNIRYYSTFHLSEEYLPYYIDNLNGFAPEYLSGFPSNVYEIAEFATRHKVELTCRPTALFSTAETLQSAQISLIEDQFHTRVADQYASSEGAPFIVRCEAGKYHFLPWTGVIETVDETGRPASEGDAIITSFTTHGTPLVRYRIGDRIRFADSNGSRCECKSECPVVEEIEGRSIDCLWSRERGRINLGNISNCVKYCHGIVKFQAIQELPDRVRILLVVDRSQHTEAEKNTVLDEFRSRLGPCINLEISYVDDIPREASGKFRIVKNLLNKHLVAMQ
jgi:phenylacetate-CoA ligase